MSVVCVPIKKTYPHSCPNIWTEEHKEDNFNGLIVELDHIGEATKFIYLVCPECGRKLIKLQDVKWIPRYESDNGYGGSHITNWKLENNKHYDNETKTVKCGDMTLHDYVNKKDIYLSCDFTQQLSFFSYGG